MNTQSLPATQYDEEAPGTPLWKSEREKMLLLPKKYHDFIAILFRKIRECCDGTLPGFPDPKTLMYSDESPTEYTFRCGPHLKITLPKGLNTENFPPRDIERLVDVYSVEMDGVGFSPEVWHGFPLYRLRGVKDQTTKKVDKIIDDPSDTQPKDRSMRGRLSRVRNKLLPGTLPADADEASLSESSVSDAEGVKKLKFVNRAKFPHIILRKKA